jgi:vacuolar-type H+-ATPase catalytic subunit A/Vma1
VEEPLPDDELPNYMRKSQNIDMSKLKEMGPEGVKSMSKKGKTLMMFVTVAGTPTDRETEELTALWQSSLFNANLQTTRYVMESNKAIFMVDDGSKAYEIKDFLVRQENCLEVVIDQETYPGIYAKEDDMTWSKGGKKAKKVKKSAKKSEEKNYEEKKSEEKKNEKEDL